MRAILASLALVEVAALRDRFHGCAQAIEVLGPLRRPAGRAFVSEIAIGLLVEPPRDLFGEPQPQSAEDEPAWRARLGELERLGLWVAQLDGRRAATGLWRGQIPAYVWAVSSRTELDRLIEACENGIAAAG